MRCQFVGIVMMIGMLTLAAPALADEEPAGLYLTWQQAPTTTMTIDWHTEPNEDDDVPDSILHYKPLDAEDGAWEQVEGASHAFPYSDRTVHRVELTGLEPGATYRFRVGEFGRVYKFRTMPEHNQDPIRFATGGDTRHRQSWMERTNRVAMAYDLDFVAWGGDLAYADGREGRVGRWYEWFEAIMNTLITDDGRVVPIVVSTGNHEVRSGYHHRHDDYEQTDEWRERIAPYFYALLAFPGQPGYGVLDFDDYLSLISLDSDHTNPIEGEQAEWLAHVLSERTDVPHVIPFYHVPAFPSHRRYGGRVSTRVREYWVPLFEAHGVRVAFENHDHTYKRTFPILGEQVHPQGIVYIGDGAWGVSTREGGSRDEWYIAEFASKRHAIIVTLHGSYQHFLTVNEDGEIIDEYPQTPASMRQAEWQDNRQDDQQDDE